MALWPNGFVEEQYANGDWDAVTFSDRLRELSASRPRGHALIDDTGRVTTWAQYDARATELAERLSAIGARHGAAIGIMYPDNPSLHIAWLAAERAGLVIVAIPKKAGFGDISRLMSASKAEILLTAPASVAHRDPLSIVSRLRGEAGWHGCHVTFDADSSGIEVTLDGSPSVPAPGSTALPIGPDELYLLNFTSGTTGRPKGVMHSQNRWKYQVRNCPHLTGDDRFLGIVPASGAFGIWMTHTQPLMVGAPLVVLDEFDTGATLSAIEKHAITVLACVPTQLKMLLKDPSMSTTDFTSLRIVHLGGEPMPVEQALEFERRTSSSVVQMYGATETGAVTIPTPTWETPQRRLAAAGRANPAMHLRLVDENDEYVSIPGKGRPVVRGPGITPGYFEDPAANDILFREDGWVRLGDIVEIDDDGYLSVVGRLSDFIIRGGLNISAVEVEEYVAQHPDVTMAAAIPMPDPVMGERVCVYVQPRPGVLLTLSDLLRFLENQGFSKSKWPEHLIVLDRLPVGPAGKVSKGMLKSDLAARTAARASVSD